MIVVLPAQHARPTLTNDQLLVLVRVALVDVRGHRGMKMKAEEYQDVCGGHEGEMLVSGIQEGMRKMKQSRVSGKI